MKATTPTTTTSTRIILFLFCMFTSSTFASTGRLRGDFFDHEFGLIQEETGSELVQEQEQNAQRQMQASEREKTLVIGCSLTGTERDSVNDLMVKYDEKHPTLHLYRSCVKTATNNAFKDMKCWDRYRLMGIMDCTEKAYSDGKACMFTLLDLNAERRSRMLGPCSNCFEDTPVPDYWRRRLSNSEIAARDHLRELVSKKMKWCVLNKLQQKGFIKTKAKKMDMAKNFGTACHGTENV